MDGRTPLAVLFNNAELGRYLISQGADVFLRDSDKPGGQSVLQICAEYGETWILEEVNTRLSAYILV